MDLLDDQLVSIITPCYNSEAYISNTIESVISQTYVNWEMIIVDDCSTDKSADIIKKYAETDKRIIYIKTEVASGSPTLPRNVAISNARGRFIAFLDSDDIWEKDKLYLQLPQLMKKDVAIVYSYYEKITEEGERSGRIVKSAPIHTYSSLLYGNEIACLTAVVDITKVGKVYFEKVGHEDYVMWLSILKMGFIAKNIPISLARYRVRKSSVSSNKMRAVKWVWNIYRNIEKKTLLASIFYSLIDLSKSFKKSLI